MSETVQDLVQNLLNSDPENRISISDVINHPFLKNHLKPEPKKVAPPKVEIE